MIKVLSIDEINLLNKDIEIDDNLINRESMIHKMSEQRKGVTYSAETRAKISATLTGQPISQTRRDKIAEANRGVPLSAERREKISARMSKYFYHTPNGVFETMRLVINAYPEYTKNQLNKWLSTGSNGFYRISK